jgi:hypothetical protein
MIYHNTSDMKLEPGYYMMAFHNLQVYNYIFALPPPPLGCVLPIAYDKKIILYKEVCFPDAIADEPEVFIYKVELSSDIKLVENNLDKYVFKGMYVNVDDYQSMYLDGYHGRVSEYNPDGYYIFDPTMIQSITMIYSLVNVNGQNKWLYLNKPIKFRYKIYEQAPVINISMKQTIDSISAFQDTDWEKKYNEVSKSINPIKVQYNSVGISQNMMATHIDQNKYYFMVDKLNRTLIFENPPAPMGCSYIEDQGTNLKHAMWLSKGASWLVFLDHYHLNHAYQYYYLMSVEVDTSQIMLITDQDEQQFYDNYALDPYGYRIDWQKICLEGHKGVVFDPYIRKQRPTFIKYQTIDVPSMVIFDPSIIQKVVLEYVRLSSGDTSFWHRTIPKELNLKTIVYPFNQIVIHDGLSGKQKVDLLKKHEEVKHLYQ